MPKHRISRLCVGLDRDGGERKLGQAESIGEKHRFPPCRDRPIKRRNQAQECLGLVHTEHQQLKYVQSLSSIHDSGLK